MNTYDLFSRVVTSTAPNGGVTTTSFAVLTTTVTNALGESNTTVQNDQGLTASVTDNLGNSTNYAYDAFGDLLATTDPVGNTISNTYDTRGRKTAMADPDMGSWSYSYDTQSELVSQTDAKGQTTTITYDQLGRMTQRVEPDLTSTWTYDTATNGIGKLASASTGAGYSRVYTYDSLTRPTGVAITPASGASAQTFSATYDANSRLSTVTYPSGFIVTYTYTTLGYQYQLSNGTTTYWTANIRDAELHLISQTAGNGVSTTNTFDPQTGFLTAASAGVSGAVANFTYTYDLLGDLTARTDANESLTEAFAYDGLNRLTSYQVNSNTAKTVTYDALGDIISKSDTGTYTYPAAGSAQPHAVSSIAGTLNTSFTYDANGNLTTGSGRTATWTSYNMAATVAQGTTSFAYTYDSEHGRVIQAETGVQTTTYVNGLGILAEQVTTPAGTLTQWNDYLFAGGQMVGVHFEFPSGGAACAGGTSCDRYYHMDHLGSIAVLTDDSGTVQQRLSYDAWGKRRNADGSDAPGGISPGAQTTRGFTGQEEMDDVGLVNMNARVYDPTVGRFMSADPTISAIDDLQIFNRYSYVANNPLSATDPTGYCGWFCDIISPLGGVINLIPAVGKFTSNFAKNNQQWLQPIMMASSAGCGYFAVVCAAGTAAYFTDVDGGSVRNIIMSGAIAAAEIWADGEIGSATNGDFSPDASGQYVNSPGAGVAPQTPMQWISNSPQLYAANVAAHAGVGCLLSTAGGGRCGAGALAAGFTAAAGPFLVGQGRYLGAVESATLGGASSVLGGGKFANGAVTGAYGYLFNSAAGQLKQQHQLSVLEADLQNPNVQAFLSAIAQAEGATYNTLYGGGTFSDYSSFPGSGDNTASGRYQILGSTYDYLSGELGLSDFSPHTQDLMAAQLLVEDRAMGSLLSGNFDAALSAASHTWAALPIGSGLSNRYPGQPYMPYDRVRSNYDLAGSP